MSAAEHKDEGTKHFKAKEYAEAARSYTRAIELEPGHAAYWRFRGELHMRAGDPERALADCRAAERLLALRGGAPRSLLDLIARLEAELAGGR